MSDTTNGTAAARALEPKPQADGAIGCKMCIEYEGKMAPSHNGSPFCRSGSLASGGHR